MMRFVNGHGCARWMSAVLVAVSASGLVSLAARADMITWERAGQFETCLDQEVNSWINSKAELVINDDPAAGDLDDIDVALWAVTALQGCEQQAGRGNQTSENRFSRHMAHWREHIHTVAQAVRSRGGSD